MKAIPVVLKEKIVVHIYLIDLMHKDLNLVIDQAKLIGSETPLTNMMLNSQEESQSDGDNRMDATVIIRNYLKEEKND